MPGTIKYGERKLEKIVEFYYSFFCKSLVHTSTLKENSTPPCKNYSLCSCCRDITGWNTVLIEEWDFSAV
jgi:hypothetical protein